MPTISVILRTKRRNSNGESPLYLRINSGDDRAFKSLDIWINPKQWDSKKELVKPSNTKGDNSAIFNQAIQTVKARAMAVIANTMAQNLMLKTEDKLTDPLTAHGIKDSIFREEVNYTDKTVFHYYEIYLQQLKKSDRFNNYKKQKSVRNKFRNYLENQKLLKNKDIAFEKIDIPLIKNYIKWIQDNSKNTNNTINRELLELGVMFNEAIKTEYIKPAPNPFSFIKLKAEKVIKKPLYSDELFRLQNLQLKPGSLEEKVRDMFLFQIYTAGLRVSDLFVVTWDSIINDGKSFYYEMQKTGRPKELMLVDPAFPILDKYGPPVSGKYIFDFLAKPLSEYKSAFELKPEISRKTSLYNKYLKKLQVKAKIKTRLTSHIARHTFAHMARSLDLPLTTVQHALGHTSSSITEKYLRDFKDASVDKGMALMFNTKKTG